MSENNLVPGGEENAVTVAVTNKKDSLRFFYFGILGFLGVLVVFFGAISVVRAYVTTSLDTPTRVVARLLRLPALKINGLRVLYSDYAEDMEAIKQLQEYNTSSGGQAPELSQEQMSDQVIFRLVNNVLLAEAAKTFGVEASDQDVAELKSQVVQQFPSEADVDKELVKRYGWDLKTYERKVMRPFIIQNKLAQKIQGDPARREEIKSRAQEVLEQIKNKGDFAALAKQYGQDGTAAEGGDLGWFGKGDMVPEFEEAVFGLKKGQVASDLVETQYGYHIIKLDDRKTESSKDQGGKTVSVEKVKARHILFRFPTLDEYLDGVLKQSRVQFYLKVNNPLAGLTPQ